MYVPVAVVCLSFATGCSLILPSSDELAGGEAAGQDGSCPGTAGPKMIDVGAYCIDSTEVTAQEYAAFLNADVPTSDNPDASCAVNNPSYEPATWPNGEIDERPVTFVDFCDAAGYCAFAGKRLCGGDGGAPIPSEGYDPPDPAHDEWYGACTNGGTTAYPYGDVQVAEACHRTPDGIVTNVQAYPSCHGKGAFELVFDLGGNASEWVNVCQGEYCRTNGGATGISSDECSTDPVSIQVKLSEQSNLGFRCCADAK
jgi:formylglycine-generating enzyme required for sulfatase activity